MICSCKTPDHEEVDWPLRNIHRRYIEAAEEGLIADESHGSVVTDEGEEALTFSRAEFDAWVAEHDARMRTREPSDTQVLGLVRHAQGIVDSMKSSAGRRTRGDEWCYVRYGQVSALEEVLGGMGKVSAPLDDDVVEAGADYLWRRLTAVGTKPGPAMTECQEIMRAALRAAGGA